MLRTVFSRLRSLPFRFLVLLLFLVSPPFSGLFAVKDHFLFAGNRGTCSRSPT